MSSGPNRQQRRKMFARALVEQVFLEEEAATRAEDHPAFIIYNDLHFLLLTRRSGDLPVSINHLPGNGAVGSLQLLGFHRLARHG